ncbi:uncharacterized protein BT62DRAFT_1081266 [Guyanagaster necrorhizus]|uniref:Uncharacterized protein n=1 Tax=Guyanagaster necrorhizus TaxID=856835 RepID=A0A9P7VH56_9AGAR|nr:uncharacterized protein BT62DRAFT_1081266 [Guyanagaster necrorhizus MCA 3950]KAG7439874.1 hypothetical protein BT62DRAFT_1081266 [Guyanagaster necrorhizus MCA 3950]
MFKHFYPARVKDPWENEKGTIETREYHSSKGANQATAETGPSELYINISSPPSKPQEFSSFQRPVEWLSLREELPTISPFSDVVMYQNHSHPRQLSRHHVPTTNQYGTAPALTQPYRNPPPTSAYAPAQGIPAYPPVQSHHSNHTYAHPSDSHRHPLPNGGNVQASSPHHQHHNSNPPRQEQSNALVTYDPAVAARNRAAANAGNDHSTAVVPYNHGRNQASARAPYTGSHARPNRVNTDARAHRSPRPQRHRTSSDVSASSTSSPSSASSVGSSTRTRQGRVRVYIPARGANLYMVFH